MTTLSKKMEKFEKLQRKWRRFLRKQKKSKLFLGRGLDNSPVEFSGNTQKKIAVMIWLKRIFWVLFFLGVLVGFVILGWILSVASDAPDLKEIESRSFNQSSVIFDRSGEIELYSKHGEENRQIVSLNQISQHMKDALLAIEDWQFYEHNGVSFRGIARAGLNSLQGTPTGASTLSQQLVKMVFFAGGGEKTWKARGIRKIQEIALTLELEKHYSKDRILELYLNKAPFGRNTYGIESAAQSYFGKSANDLTITEAAVLAGLPKSPSRYSRRIYSYLDLSDEEMDDLGVESYQELKNLGEDVFYKYYRKGLLGDDVYFAGGKIDHINGRFDLVLAKMLEKEFITQEEYDFSLEEIKTLVIRERKTDIKAPHFVFYAEEEAEKILKQVFPETYSEDLLTSGGFKIYTSIDMDLQTQTEEILKEQGITNADYNIRNAAALVLDPKTGEVLTMVGSRDYYGTYIHPKTGESLALTEKEMIAEINTLYADISEEEVLQKVKSLEISGKVNVLTSLRQPGSTFKPLAYGAGFEFRGLAPATVLMDVKTDFGSGYTPRNFDGRFHGPISLRKSLGNSYNIGAVKVGIIAGLPNVYEFAKNLGIHFSRGIDFYGSAISLGSAEISPLDMGIAYSAFANGGSRVKPVVILKILDENNDIIYEYNHLKAKQEMGASAEAMSPETAFLITSILSDASGEARPTAWNGNLTIANQVLAAKTGTSTVKFKNGKIAPHDAWVIGYSPLRTTVVWTGNNKGWKGNKYGALGANASGLKNAGPIFKKIMTAAHADLDAVQFSRPAGISQQVVSKLSGKLIPENFPEVLKTKDYFSRPSLPDSEDESLKIIRLVDASKKYPNEYTPEKAIKEFLYINLNSYYPNNKNWEDPVKEWVTDNRAELTEKFGVKDVISYLPDEDEIDQQYNPETENNRPRVTILSPANMGTIAPPKIDIDLDIFAFNGVEYVEIFWDDELVATKNSAPWKTSVHLGDAKIGTVHTLTVKATDRKLYDGETTIQLRIGEDGTPPEISFLYPQLGDSVSAGSLVQVSVDAIDKNSAVANVQFFVNDVEEITLYQMPFQFPWSAPEKIGRYNIKAIATDKSGNKAEKTVSFTVVADVDASSAIVDEETGEVLLEAEENSGPLEVISPENSERVSGSVPFLFFVPEKLRISENIIEFHVKKTPKGRKNIIYTISGDKVPSSGKISFSYSFEDASAYSAQVRVRGGVSSQKILFTVE